jgi:hypothetical protein
MGALAITDLHELDGEARVRDLDLAERLGYERPRKLRDLIRRNEVELARYGVVPTIREVRGVSPRVGAKPAGGRPTECFLLNEPQALLVVMRADTAAAADVRQQVIEVFMAWRQGRLSPQAGPVDPLAAQLAALRHELEQMRIDTGRVRESTARIEARVQGMGGLKSVAEAMDAGAAGPGLRYINAAIGMKFSGRGGVERRDPEVAAYIATRHRLATIDSIRAAIIARFGHERCPPRSSVGRYLQKLDRLSGLANGRLQ